MLTVRPLDEQGNWQYKTEKEYLCVRNGEERGFTAAEFKAAQADGWEKQYPYKVGRKKVYMPSSEADKHGSVNVCVRSNRHSRSRTRRKAETGGSGKISAGVHRSKCTPAFYIYFRIL